MKKGLLVILSLLFSFAGYANQCSEYWYKYNYEKAFTYCKEDAEQGDAEGQYHLAFMYNEGFGTKQDKKRRFIFILNQLNKIILMPNIV